MRTDPDGLPKREDRLALANALRTIMAEHCPDATPELAAAIGAMAASRFFGVRFRAEGNDAHAWIARRPNPDVCEVWDPLMAGPVWDFLERLPDPQRYASTPEGTARVAAHAQEHMATIADMARRVQALALGIEADEV